MNKSHKFSLLLVFVLIAGTACNLPGATPTEEPALTSTPTSTPEAATEEPAATQEAAECVPTVTTTTDANVRNGPGLVYGVYGIIPQGGTANVAGKNAGGDWWYIEFAGGEGGHGWIAGSVTTAACIPDTLAIIAAPPAPVAQDSSNTNTNESNQNNNENNNDNDNGGSPPVQPVDPIIIVGVLQLPPNPPSNINVSKSCIPTGVFPFAKYTQTNTITWKDNSANETGFKVYRFGTLITTTGANVQQYVDVLVDQAPNNPNEYSVVATNGFGDSAKISKVISGCN